MGPLVPEIFSNEFSLVIAFLVGIGFGFILEQAGFSTSRKLVGLFYGYDFTVLRVFFTAGTVAMIGVLVLGHLGLLDLGLIYVNPTFLWSAIIGGCIMGAGFVIGGFCPGTSFCAAAIGKLDAMIFIIGSIIGIFIFTEVYPLIENIYFAENWGAVRADEYLGMTSNLYAFLLTLIAVVAFLSVTFIENHVNDRKTDLSRLKVIRYSLLGAIPFAVIALLVLTPSRDEYIQAKIREARQQRKCVFKEISADKLAYELINNHFKINLIDVRDSKKFEEYHLPLAVNVPVDSMVNRGWDKFFKQDYKINIFYADVDTTAKMACLLANFLGKSENYILRETTDQFREMFFNPILPPPDARKEVVEIYNFRSKAASDLQNLEDALKKFSQPVKNEVRKAKGGCS
jgi:rhodanese-related sulfurtransferase